MLLSQCGTLFKDGYEIVDFWELILRLPESAKTYNGLSFFTQFAMFGANPGNLC
jgi:hypothetical protein